MANICAKAGARQTAAFLLSVCALTTATVEPRAQDFLFSADQYGKLDFVAPQALGTTKSIIESLGAQTDRFEPMNRFRADDPFRRLGRAVGRLDMLVENARNERGTSVCTATLIAADRIITNYHCVPGLGGSRVLAARVNFGYLEQGSSAAASFDVDIRPIQADARLDFAVLAVSGNPGARFAVMPLRMRAALDNESLFIIHHPAGQPQKLTRAYCRAHPNRAVDGTSLRHQCDTLGGSSGSLVMALSDNAVVGIHHRAGLNPIDPMSYNLGTDANALKATSSVVADLCCKAAVAQPASPTPATQPAPVKQPVVAQPAPAVSWTRMPNHFVEGQGFQRSDTASAADCEQLCARQPSCQLYEFYKPDRSCSLFDQVRKSAPSKDADVGVRVSSASAVAPVATGPKLWNHNGSTMTLQFEGNKRRFVYEQPRAGIAARGAKQGTILFEGTRTADVYSGLAKLFRGSPCGEFNYTVSGTVATDQKSVTLRGRAPIVEEGTCRITGYRDDELVFTLIE